MLKNLISKISNNNSKKSELSFFDLSSEEKAKIIKRAAELSAQDQNDLLLEYDRKFGKLQTNNCK